MKFLAACFCFVFALSLNAQHKPIGEWWFWPDYTLPGKANNYPGPRVLPPKKLTPTIGQGTLPLTFHGEDPTERINGLLDPSDLSSKAFSLEMWLVNHVNQPIGALVSLKNKYLAEEPAWLLGIYEQEVIFSLKTQKSPFAELVTHQIKSGGWKKYWLHLVATYDSNTLSLYVNGEKVKQTEMGMMKEYDPGKMELELASYMENEPYMDLGNLVKCLRIYDHNLETKEIKGNFESLQKMVVEGKLFPDMFHFNAGPYLNYSTKNSINILWETDRPSTAEVYYGTSLPLSEKIIVKPDKIDLEGGKSDSHIYEVTLNGLKSGQQYFYNIKATSDDGSKIESGNLTFSTAVEENMPYVFAVIGDTEARPHINDQISKLVWDERPNFIVVVGDLTDGGKRHHKFEWNYEYFQGMNQLTSRIPVFPVAGNGESDLHWYKRYHALPENEEFYSFNYGNAEFFMLNSNEKADFAPDGRQYAWLENKLKASKAQWKFVAHHHAPYSADEDDYGNSWKGESEWGDPEVRKIVKLYEEYGVDMVFFGHLHTYQRTLPILDNTVNEKNGVIYVQGGGGGGNLEDFAPSRAWFSAKTYRGYHYFTVTVAGSTLDFKMYNSEGTLKDVLNLKKTSTN